MVHFHLNQLVKGIVSKCSHLLSHRGKGLNTGVWGPGAGTGARRGQGSSGGGEGPAGQQGAGWGEGTTQPSCHREAGPPSCVRGTRGEPEKWAAVPILPPSWGSWEAPFCSKGPGLSRFPPPPQLLTVQPCPAARMWTVRPRRCADTAARPLPPRRPQLVTSVTVHGLPRNWVLPTAEGLVSARADCR